MKFDNIIMNPPYDGNLHLKILESVISTIKSLNSVCSNLSPVRWLQDPLAKYKKSKTDFETFEDSVGKHIESLDIIDIDKTEKYFNTPIPVSLGIYGIRKEDKYNYLDKCRNNLLEKVINSPNFSPVSKQIKLSEPMGYAVITPLIYKGIGPHRVLEAVTHWMLEKDRAFYNDNKNITTGESYFEYRKKVSWGKVKPRPDITHISFKSDIERQNFYDSCETEFFRYIFTVETVDVHVQIDFLPFMNDYTKPWTNERFCQAFGITGFISNDCAEKDSDWEEILNFFN